MTFLKKIFLNKIKKFADPILHFKKITQQLTAYYIGQKYLINKKIWVITLKYYKKIYPLKKNLILTTEPNKA